MIRGTIEEKGGREGTGAKEEPEDRETTGGAPEELRGGRETPEEEKEGRDKGKGKPGGGKDTVDAEEAVPKEGKRKGAEEDDGTDDTPEDTPDHRQDASRQGPPKDWQNPQTPSRYKGPSEHTLRDRTDASKSAMEASATAMPWSVETTRTERNEVRKLSGKSEEHSLNPQALHGEGKNHPKVGPLQPPILRGFPGHLVVARTRP